MEEEIQYFGGLLNLNSNEKKLDKMSIIKRFFTWYDSQTMITRLVILGFTVYNTFWISRLIGLWLIW